MEKQVRKIILFTGGKIICKLTQQHLLFVSQITNTKLGKGSFYHTCGAAAKEHHVILVRKDTVIITVMSKINKSGPFLGICSSVEVVMCELRKRNMDQAGDTAWQERVVYFTIRYRHITIVCKDAIPVAVMATVSRSTPAWTLKT